MYGIAHNGVLQIFYRKDLDLVQGVSENTASLIRAGKDIFQIENGIVKAVSGHKNSILNKLGKGIGIRVSWYGVDFELKIPAEIYKLKAQLKDIAVPEEFFEFLKNKFYEINYSKLQYNGSEISMERYYYEIPNEGPTGVLGSKVVS